MGARAELRRLLIGNVIIEHKDAKLHTGLLAAILLHSALLLAGPEKMLPIRTIAPEHLFLLKKDGGFIPDVHLLLLLARCRVHRALLLEMVVNGLLGAILKATAAEMRLPGHNFRLACTEHFGRFGSFKPA